MNWLSRMEIDAEVAFSLRIADSYAWHRRVWDCFPDQPSAKRDFLSRLDERAGAFRVWILSNRAPTCPSWCTSGNFSSKRISPGFLLHRKYYFDLKANPTKRLPEKAKDKKLGKRVPLIKKEDLADWLTRKGEAGGFRIVDDVSLDIGPMVQNHFRKDEHRGYHGGVQFRGALEVTDRERFKETYNKGIGSAKGFGFGLLLLAPASK